MPDDKLGVKQRAVMFVLMAEARELSNPEMAEAHGMDLTGAERRGLNGSGLVTSRKVGRALAHELTDKGWRWCREEMSAGHPKNSRESLGKALYAILPRLERYLEHAELGLADLFDVPVRQSVEDRIRASYARLASAPGDYVSLTALRRDLNGASRAEVDEVLAELNRTRQVVLVSEDAQESLTEEDRAAAIRIGNQDNHLLAIESS